MRVRTGQDVFRLPAEARLPLGPAAWSQWLRRHQSLVTITTVFVLVVAVVAARHNVEALNRLSGLSIGNFSTAADVAGLNDDAIAESSRLQGLVARINRPIPSLPDAGPVARAALEQSVSGALEGDPEGVRTYTVVQGDNAWAIATRMGLNPLSIQWSNPRVSDLADLGIGEKLRIPPVDGAIHAVIDGDSLSRIASQYKVEVAAIVGFGPNRLSSANALLSVGTQLFIPGGVKPSRESTPINYSVAIPPGALLGTGQFIHPLESRARVTQGYWPGHAALDFGGRTGTPVRAVDHGVVAHAHSGWNYGYGNMVVVDHGNGYVSLYAHLQTAIVKKGDTVRRGQTIGTLGNTGRSTGPHLHVEIRRDGRNLNPATLLPRN